MQQTLREPVTISGIGLHGGQPCTIIINPAPASHGIVFRRMDLSNTPVIPATSDHVICTKRSTSVGLSKTVYVQTVEHLLAALYGLKIDNALIDVYGNEIPILDGSAKQFVSHISVENIISLNRLRRVHTLKETISVSLRQSSLVAIPCNEFRITIIFANDYNHPAIHDQFFEWTFKCPYEFIQQISSARTFAHLKEIDVLKSQQLIQGASLDTGILINETSINQPLRFHNEFVRHKILDLLGDLSYVGYFNAHIIGIRTSHSINHQLCKELFTHFKED